MATSVFGTMQSPLFVLFMFLSSVDASRVKVRAVTDLSSSSQGACRVLAKWICQPQTYKENLGQVTQCCNAKDVGDETLRKACCQLAGAADESVSDEKTAPKPVVEKPVVVEKPDVAETPVVVENPVEDDLDEEETIDEVVADSSGDATLDEATIGQLASIWKQTEIKPNLEKTLVQAFQGSKQPGLSLAMSCVDQCEGQCESAGGECQPVQTAEDCQTAAGQLSKSFFQIRLIKANLGQRDETFSSRVFREIRQDQYEQCPVESSHA